ncbi:hypothetical protein BDZ89DRAFT_1052427 [Hymenopellis radicata]|nr:hypothetical protein BDZ89DRAFT_1052427 [Hymenopellis radicata]
MAVSGRVHVQHGSKHGHTATLYTSTVIHTVDTATATLPHCHTPQLHGQHGHVQGRLYVLLRTYAMKDAMSILVHARQDDHVDSEGLSDDDLVDQVTKKAVAVDEILFAGPGVDINIATIEVEADSEQKLILREELQAANRHHILFTLHNGKYQASAAFLHPRGV